MADDITGADLAGAMTGGGSSAADTASGGATPPESSAAATGTATTQPAGDPVHRTTGQSPQGPIPFEAHSKAIENARVKERERLTAEWEQQYGWAKQIPQADMQAAITLARRAQADPIAYMQEFIAELQSHPQHGQALRSLAAKALASGRGAGATMPEPDVAITDAAGNVVGQTYSAGQLAKRDEWLMGQWMAKMDARLAPIAKTHAETEAERQHLRDKAAGDHFAGSLMQEMQTYPRFEEHKAAIGQDVVRQLAQLATGDPRANDPAFLEAATLRAYNRVVVPQLQSTERQAVVQDLTTKATEVSGVTPGKSPTAAPKELKDLSWEDALKRESARLGLVGTR